MTKLTVNEIEYDTDNFNEEQNQILQEIILLKNKLDGLNYEVAVFEVRSKTLVNLLEESLKVKEEKKND